MTGGELANWHEGNDAYLAAAVEWLRLLLGSYVPASGAPIVAGEQRATPRESAEPPKAPWWTFRRATPSSPPQFGTPPPALPPASTEVSKQQVEEAAARMRSAENIDPPPALVLLAQRLGLSKFERDILLLCVAMELDSRIPALCARVQNDASRPFPTFALAMTIFDEPSWDALLPDRPLRLWRHVDVAQGPAQPLTTSAIHADESALHFVKGLHDLDERLVPFLTRNRVDGDDLPPSQRAVAEQIVRVLQHDQPRFQPIQLLGNDAESKQLVAAAAAQQLGLSLYRLPADMLPSQANELETLARLWHRETLESPVALYIDAHDVDRNAEAHAIPLKRFLSRAGSVVFVEAREMWPVPQGSHAFDVEKPTPAEQRALWLAAIGEENAAAAARLAGQFNLGAPAIVRIAAAAKIDNGSPLLDRLWHHAKEQTRLRIDALAQRVDAKATWDDIVLPPNETALLHQISAHVAGRTTVYDDWGFRRRMNRGLSVTTLFHGESGTGKTMAAEVIANDLGLTLHRIDLSAVVSKWVGETEKTLQTLFNAAEEATGILFFDEADALFGKRSEVQHSQDRFANIEINFLLQRLESYSGLAILATNAKDALDRAFLGRMRFIVNFPFPGPVERRAIWERAFPPETPVEALDLDRLSKLSITGRSIQSIALSAAFLAAQKGERVSMPLVLEAAKTEIRKLGKTINEAEFRWNVPEPRVA
jgi:hypothetical protein